MNQLLIIEDDLDVLENLKDIFEYANYKVFTSESGVKALSILKEINPDLIICDINMPQMNGIEFLEIIKRNPDTYAIPFIFLTAMTEKEYLRKAMNLGADDFITKPFDNDEIVSAVRSKIDKFSNLKSKIESDIELAKGQINPRIPAQFTQPLQSILGFSTVLKNNYHEFDESERKNLIENIQKSSKIIIRILDNYTLYNQLKNKENFKALNENSNIEVKQLINDVIEDFKILNNSKDRIVNFANYGIIKLNLDFQRKIINEIITIASDKCYENTEILISGDIIDDAYYKLTIKFQSAGLNIDEKEIINLAENIDISDSEKKCCALSFAIVKLICELNGGRFEAESEPYDFTTITIKLPAHNS